MDDVDAAARRAAAEQRRARALEHFDALHAVHRVRKAVGLIAIGKLVAEDAGVHAANGEAVEEAVGRCAADIDAADIANRIAQIGAALLGDHRPRHDDDALRQVG
jgi:hypothetical protein